MKLHNGHRIAPIALWFTMAVSVTACNRDKKDGPESPEPVAKQNEPAGQARPHEAPATDKGTTPCQTLDRSECISALHCTMHWIANGKYECRQSAGACEVGLMQSDKPTCESRKGCTWEPGSCYCQFPGYGQTQVPDKRKNSGGACACGGGPPPLCKATSAAE